MTTNLGTRKKVFTEDVMRHLKRLPAGASSYQRQAMATMQTAIEDLVYLNCLPMHLRNLKLDILLKLIQYWKTQGISSKTIANRLSIIRKVLSIMKLPIKVPKNKEINLEVDYKAIHYTKQRHVGPYAFTCSIDLLAKEICMMQVLFGLKAYEAIQVSSGMFTERELRIPRSISYKSEDRSIPIINEDQKNFVLKFKEKLSSQLPLSRDKRIFFMKYYRITLDELQLSPIDYFRYWYIHNRYESLIKFKHPYEVFEIIRNETGYTQIPQIRRIVECLKSF